MPLRAHLLLLRGPCPVPPAEWVSRCLFLHEGDELIDKVFFVPWTATLLAAVTAKRTMLLMARSMDAAEVAQDGGGAIQYIPYTKCFPGCVEFIAHIGHDGFDICQLGIDPGCCAVESAQLFQLCVAAWNLRAGCRGQLL